MSKGESRSSYLAKNTALFAMSSFGSKILTFLLVPLYTRCLTTSDYGTVDLIGTVSSLLLFIFTLNISSAVLRFLMDSKSLKNEIYGFAMNIFLIGFLLLTTIVFIVKQSGLITWNNIYFYLLAIYFTSGLNELLSNYMRALDKIKLVVTASFITSIITVICNLLFLLVFKLGFDGYMYSLLIGNMVSCIIYLVDEKPKLFCKMVQNDFKRKMLTYSIPLIFNGIAWWIVQSSDRFFINTKIGLDANGLYAVASKIPTTLSMILSIFMQAWALSAIREYNKDDTEEFYSVTYNVINSVLILSASILIILNIPIAKLMFAKDFFEAWNYSSMLIFAGIFNGLSSIVGSVFSAAKRTSMYAISTVFGAIINVILNALLIPICGINGATVATAFSFFIIWLVRYICSRKIIRIQVNWRRDISCYILIICQIIIEHFDTHCYFIQSVILLFLILLNSKNISTVLVTIKELCKNYIQGIS